MPRNLEIKARINDISNVLQVTKSLDLQFVGELNQCDTYFVVPKGRLKLRETNDSNAELIFYLREEATIQRESFFDIYPIIHPSKLKTILTSSLGIKAIVNKRRLLFLFNDTRIHIDEVDGLGNFIEFEVPIMSDSTEAKSEMNYLIGQFGVHETDYIKCSYVDLTKKTNPLKNQLF